MLQFDKINLKKIKEDLTKNKIMELRSKLLPKSKIMVLAASIIIFLLVSTQLKSVFLVILLVALASISHLSRVFFPFVVGFDIVLFMLIILFFAHGFWIALILALIAHYIGLTLRSQISHVYPETYVGPPLGYVVTAFLVSVLAFKTIFIAGIAATIIYTLFMMAFYWVFYHSIIDEATFLLTSIPFNYWLFANYGQKILVLVNG